MRSKIQSLDNFVIGKQNQFSYMALMDMLECNTLDSCIFLYGKSGSGKTHLLKEIFQECSAYDDVIYVTAENFLNDCVKNKMNQTMDRFRTKYRSCNVLILDDLQFFEDKSSIQEELYHTVSDIKAKKGQVIIASDKHPENLIGLHEYLQNELLGFLVTKIKLPKKEIMLEVAKNISDEMGLNLDNKTIKFVVKNSTSINALEGMMLKLNAHSAFCQIELNFKLVKQFLLNH